MAARAKLPPRFEVGTDRPTQLVQTAQRDITKVVNGIMRCVAIESYGATDASTWGSALSATSGSTYVDTIEQKTLSSAVQPGDVLVINGRAPIGTDAGLVMDAQLVVYEATRALATQKPETYWHLSGVGFDKFTFHCRHTITKAGLCTVAMQIRVVSGVGNVYLYSHGAFVVEVWRP